MMAKNGGKIPDFLDEVEDKIHQAQDRGRRAQDSAASLSKRYASIQQQLDVFKAGMQKIQGEPAPLIADHLKSLEKSASTAADEKQRGAREATAAQKELAELTHARDQLKQMRA
jgi:chromosome segregation ATPase